jgi:hypothetical protein
MNLLEDREQGNTEKAVDFVYFVGFVECGSWGSSGGRCDSQKGEIEQICSRKGRIVRLSPSNRKNWLERRENPQMPFINQTAAICIS